MVSSWEKIPRLYIKKYFRLLVKQPNIKFIILLICNGGENNNKKLYFFMMY